MDIVTKSRYKGYNHELLMCILRTLNVVGGMFKELDCSPEESEFEAHYYAPFRTNTLGKRMNTLIFSAMG